jgi:hypothetical protein
MFVSIRAALLLSGAVCATAHAGVNSFTFTGPEGGYTADLAVQPGHPEVVLAATSRGVYRSTDSGAHWSLVTPQRILGVDSIAFDPVDPDRVYLNGVSFWRSVDAGLTFTEVTTLPSRGMSLAVSGNRVYLSTVDGEIRRSDDHAQTWTTLTVPWTVSMSPPVLYGIAADPSNDEVLYACVQNQGIYKTVNHGGNWSPPAPGPCADQYGFTWHIAVSPGDSSRVIAPTSNGVYLSTNGGASWSNVLSTLSVLWVEFDPHAPNNVLSASNGDGWIRRSTDGGATWPWIGAHLNLQEVEGAAFGGAAGQLYLATGTGPLYSADNGDTFAPRLTGMQASTVREVQAADDGTIYALQTWGQSGLWKRTPASWTALDNAELKSKVTILDPIAFSVSASNSSLLYYADESRLYRTNNGGADWTGPPASLDTQVFGIAVDPTNPLVAYAGVATGGLKRTADGGLTYTACGLSSSIAIDFLRVDRSNPEIVYAAGAYSPNRRMYKSLNHCQSWIPVSPTFTNGINDFVIHPVDHNRLFLVHYEGVEESRDGGASWQPLHFNLQFGDAVFGLRMLIDPLLPSTMWVINGDLAGFTRSVDDGATWQTVNFLSGGAGVSLDNGVLDPLHPDTLVAGTTSFGLVEYQVAPDLELLMSQLENSMPADASVGPHVYVRNKGPQDASAADVDITLPPFLTMENTPSNCTGSGDSFRCHVGPVRTGQQVEFELPLHISSTGSGAITATLTGHETDPVVENNTVTRTTSAVRNADLEMQAPATVTVGHGRTVDLAYTIVNHGPRMAVNTGAHFSLPEGVEVASVGSPAGTCVILSRLLASCQFGLLGADMSAKAVLRVTGVDVGTHEILADATGDVTDAGQDQHARTAVEVHKLADLSLQVSTNNATKTTNTPFQYTVTVRNNGPDGVYSHVDFTITGAAVNSASTAIGGCVTVPSVRCTLSELVSGGFTEILLTLEAGAAGPVSGEITVSHTDTDVDDPDTANNRGTLTATVTSTGGGSSSSSAGGGGGGGRFDWLALGLLGVLLASRGWLRASARR